jgi:hypothetical protein
MSKKTELAKAADEKKELAMAEQYAGLMSVDDQTDVKDIILPKILVMQGLSDLVADGKAMMGELRESLDGRLLAAKEGKLEVIPFHSTKTWAIFEESKGKLEYKETVPWGPENCNWEWTANVNGVNVRRDQCLNFYVLVASEIKEGSFMPYMLSFRRTSYKAGKKLVTAKEKLKMFKRPLASKCFELSAMKTENDLGTFYVFDVVQGRDTTPEELEAVKGWFDMIQTASVKVDDSDLRSISETELHDTDAVDGRAI